MVLTTFRSAKAALRVRHKLTCVMDQGPPIAIEPPLRIGTMFQQQEAQAVHRVFGCYCQWVIPVRRKHRTGVLMDGTQLTDTQPVSPLAAMSQLIRPQWVTIIYTEGNRSEEPPGLVVQLLPCARGSTRTGCCGTRDVRKTSKEKTYVGVSRL